MSNKKIVKKSKPKANLKTDWDLSPLFISDKDPRIEEEQLIARQAADKFITKWHKRKDYLSQPAALREALKDYDQWLADHGPNSRVCYYFHLRTELNQNDPELRARFNKAKELAVSIQNDIQFFTLRLAKIPPKTQRELLASPTLADFKHFLEKIFAEGKYTLSEAEEKVINLFHETSYSNWVKMIESLISSETFEGHSFAELLATVNSRDQETRAWAFRAINDILAKHADVAEAEMNSLLAFKKTNDELRGAKRPDELRHLSDDISSEVVDVMSQTVAERFDLPRRYYELKARLLGLPNLKYYEKSVPYGELARNFDYDESVNLVDKVLVKLDKELAEIFRGFVNNGQIDVFPHTSRANGAFCSNMRKIDPTYILLNHTNQLKDVMTLAHETGHGLNNELIKQKQREIYYETPVSTGEVASTFVEDFALEELGRGSNPQDKLRLVMAKLDDDVATIFRQVAAYRFEHELHQTFRAKGYLSKQEIGDLFLKHMKDYTGAAMEFPTGTENWWVYWSHFRYYFYVYSYASGLLISKALQQIVRDKPDKISLVKEFLATGSSASPDQIFAKLGLDITKPDVWQAGLAEIERLLNEAEELYNETKDHKIK
ncbi:MAG TPA: M3 family oligoendopeptidase [Candidatus Paceibacterota bacterium]|jgi:oligoendopeptidase F|nr:M3 family oligoendopeptidase [Candidatus Paceibacterota bacterium]HOY11146.1 M3 family oligoendopeptidase [Candidatus Paceibacterota bacterium]HPB60696.1 M3 family oligoendopeptidase [Candidatus Paceibacterota bacterium]HPI24611.1 M3 family oligoendopeptidase [Candidatus Paceibacterota bacterium]HPN89655.1 M3 family oligoendopeptidase [Candidatus Paceibacterota bacterium]